MARRSLDPSTPNRRISAPEQPAAEQTSRLLELGEEVQAIIYSYLPNPTLMLKVCKSMAPPVEGVLNKEYSRLSSSDFLSPIQKQFSLLYGEPDASDKEEVERRICNIRRKACLTIEKSMFWLHDLEWAVAGFDPDWFFYEACDFDKMRALIRDRRTNCLLSFFNWICKQVPAAEQFLSTLPSGLSSLEKTRQIRRWMAAHADLLDGITVIPIDKVFPQDVKIKNGIPPEILLLRKLNVGTLRAIFNRAAGDANIELVQKMIPHPEILDSDIEEAFKSAANIFHLGLFETLITSARSKMVFARMDVSPFIIYMFQKAAGRGRLKLVKIFIDLKQKSILISELKEAIQDALDHGHLKIVKKLIETRPGDITANFLKKATHQAIFRAAVVGFPEIVEKLIATRPNDITKDSIATILCEVYDMFRSFNLGSLKAIHALMNHRKDSEVMQIPHAYLREFLKEAVRNGPAITLDLLAHPEFSKLDANDLQYAFSEGIEAVRILECVAKSEDPKRAAVAHRIIAHSRFTNFITGYFLEAFKRTTKTTRIDILKSLTASYEHLELN